MRSCPRHQRDESRSLTAVRGMGEVRRQMGKIRFQESQALRTRRQAMKVLIEVGQIANGKAFLHRTSTEPRPVRIDKDGFEVVLLVRRDQYVVGVGVAVRKTPLVARCQ